VTHTAAWDRWVDKDTARARVIDGSWHAGYADALPLVPEARPTGGCQPGASRAATRSPENSMPAQPGPGRDQKPAD